MSTQYIIKISFLEWESGRLVWNPIHKEHRCQSKEEFDETCSVLLKQAETGTSVNGQRIGAIRRIIHQEDVVYTAE